MECIVFSDTHGNYPLALEALHQSSPVDLIFHLGDEADDARMIEHICMKKVQKVSGNCDAPGRYPREINMLIGTTRLLLTHGDRYGVKSGLAKLVERAVSEKVDVVLYGHTHQASIDTIDGILFVNPGALHMGSPLKSYARLSLRQEKSEAQIVVVAE